MTFVVGNIDRLSRKNNTFVCELLRGSY